VELEKQEQAYNTAKAAAESADNDFKAADAANTAAETAYNTAKGLWQAAWDAYTKVDGELTTATTDYNAAVTAEANALKPALDKWNELDALQKAKKTLDDEWRVLRADWKTKFEAFEAAQKAFEPVYAAYRALPEEADAWKTGDELSAAYRKKFPPK
jgi:hypothetical protein